MDPSNTGEFSLDFEKGEDKYFDDFRYANIKYLSFNQFKDQKDKLILYQDFTLNKGGIFWDGSYLLIQYFLKFLHDEKMKDKWVLELGAGTSLPSIILKLLGYKVVATDLKYLIEFVKKNVFLNIASDCDDMFINELEWGKKEDFNAIKRIIKTFDFIICSELIYIEESFDDLIKTLDEFSQEDTVIVFSYRIRMKEKFQGFIEKLEKSYVISFIDAKYLENIHPNENLHLMIVKKIKLFK